MECTDKLREVVNSLHLDEWFFLNQGHKKGLQGIIQIIGNSDQLERSIMWAAKVGPGGI